MNIFQPTATYGTPTGRAEGKEKYIHTFPLTRLSRSSFFSRRGDTFRTGEDKYVGLRPSIAQHRRVFTQPYVQRDVQSRAHFYRLFCITILHVDTVCRQLDKHRTQFMTVNTEYQYNEIQR